MNHFAKLKLSETDPDGDDQRHYLFDMLLQMSQIAAGIGEGDIARILREIVDGRTTPDVLREVPVRTH